MSSFKQNQKRNKTKTFILLALMFMLLVGVFAAVSQYLGITGSSILFPVVILLSLASVWGSYWWSDKLVLKLTGAKLIEYNDNPALYNVVTEIAIAAGLPEVKIAIVDDPAPNAFATGRNPEHAIVAFTTGLLDKMSRDELQGIAAHELAHVANRDTLLMAVAATTAGIIALVGDMFWRIAFFGGGRKNRSSSGGGGALMIIAIIALIVAPIAAALLRFAVSRSREALADATAVEYTRDPAGLRDALLKLQADSTVVRSHSTAVAHLWVESPLAGGMNKLFATHPPIQDRIDALEEML